MNSLFISDLHLTANPRDEYRWQIFPWLVATIIRCEVRSLFILGDLTEQKNYHPSELVNRVVFQTLRLYRETGNLLDITILRGNHDGPDWNSAFFRFMGAYPCISFIEHAHSTSIDGKRILFLPHARDPESEWRLPDEEWEKAEIILTHMTFSGVRAENDQALSGWDQRAFFDRAKGAEWIISGDIHVPQKIGRVEYVGAPYPIRFGDSFRGRALLLLDWKKSESLFPDLIQRGVLRLSPRDDLGKLLSKFKKGDQIKAVVSGLREGAEWPAMKSRILEACAGRGVELCGLELERQGSQRFPIRPRHQAFKDSADALTKFIEREKLPDRLAEVGVGIFEESNK